MPYPLLAHLLDTAAFATLLWDEWMSVPMTDLLSAAGFRGSESLGFVAGVHDCGKADPWFVGQLGSSRAKEFEYNLQLLDAAGLPNVQNPTGLVTQVAARGGIARRMMRHEAMSGHAVQRDGLPGWVSAVVSGHHGRYQPDAEAHTRRFVGRHRSWIDASPWSGEQSCLVEQVAHALDLEMDSALPESVDGPLIPLLTGLVCLADWCASDENFLADAPLHLLDQEPTAYLQARVAQARESLRSTLGLPVHPTGSFEELFDGFTPDRAVQRWAVGAGDHGPGLTIIAVPMGEGKTETALWMHSASTAGDGLVFALPTMATADAMFDRVQRFYSGTRALAALSHGSAILNAFYAVSAASPTGICDGDDRVGLSGSEWLRGRHRSVTAPVTVSTCDQVLAAAVDHKFLPVRLASLADKHVVLDEVHTYDPYQDALLRRLLGWLGAYRIRVTLLSATLPTRRANDYLQAYATGAGAGPVEPTNGCYPAVSRLTPGHSAPAIVPVEAHRRYRHHVSCVPVVVGADSYGGYVQEFAAQTARYVQTMRAGDTADRVGVIVNTVDRAVGIAQLLEDAGVGGSEELLVLHSRMTARQRRESTRRLLDAAGPGSGPGRLLLVSTQVAEASLDIDLDVLITDLAPVTSLLQRMGRQWRHSLPNASGWTHRPVSSARGQGGPEVHILVQTDKSGQLHQHAAAPYTRAEVVKTYSAGLQCGKRTSVDIPGDLQQLVDDCDVSMANLAGEHEDAELAELIAHMGREIDAQDQAQRVGTDVGRLTKGWDLEPDWSRNPQLARLTQPSLWSAEAVTRLRDTLSADMLLLDATQHNQWAFPGSAAIVASTTLNREDLLRALGSVVPVNGALARKVLKREQPAGWHEQPNAVLRSTVPVDLSELPGLGLRLDPRMGLVKL